VHWFSLLSASPTVNTSHSITIMLRDFNPYDGLYDGMRLIYCTFLPHVIDARIVSGACVSKRVFTPRIELTPFDARPSVT
jgi:hypothetical protein